MAVRADLEDKTLGEILLEISLFHVVADQGGKEFILKVKTSGNSDTSLQLTPGIVAMLVDGLIGVLKKHEVSVTATQTEVIN